MPVHRLGNQTRSRVYAYPAELDAWLSQWEAPASSPHEPSSPVSLQASEHSSVAVLPFEFVGADTSDTYIADGFTDEVIADLAKIDALRVISRTSSMQLRARSRTLSEIAEALNAEYLLEGSVRLHGDALRSSVRLLEPHNDRQIWSEKYAGSVHDVFEIQERIARDVANAMKLRLTVADNDRLASRGTTDWAAWVAAVQARQAAWRWSSDGIDQAETIIEGALQEAPDNAYLLAALGKTHLHRREAGIDLTERTLEVAQRCADKAFAADPDSAEGFELRGWLHYSRGEIQSAVDNFKATFARQGPSPDTLGMLCNCYLISGQMRVARSLIPQVLAIDPLSLIVQALPTWADVLEGRHVDAIDLYKKLLQQEPESPILRMFLVWVLAINGRTSEVASVIDGYADKDRESLPALVASSFAAACEGIVPQPGFTPEDGEQATINDMYPRMFAQAYALAYEPDAAIEWLSLAVSRGFINYPYLKDHDPLLTRLADHAGYRELLIEVEHRWSTFVA